MPASFSSATAHFLAFAMDAGSARRKELFDSNRRT